MRKLVNLATVGCYKASVALRAGVGPLESMRTEVDSEVTFTGESFRTEGTGKITLSIMSSHVKPELVPLTEGPATLAACKWLLFSVCA